MQHDLATGADMAIRVCVAGMSGRTGSAIARAILRSDEFELVGAIARRSAGQDAGEVLGLPAARVIVVESVKEALAAPTDVLVDYTSPRLRQGKNDGSAESRSPSRDREFGADGGGLLGH